MDTLDERTLALLEWPAIREMLAAEAASPVGSELARGVRPLHTLVEARSVQEEIGEFRVLLSKDTALPSPQRCRFPGHGPRFKGLDRGSLILSSRYGFVLCPAPLSLSH